jgi:hypothetical protein
MLTRGLQPYPAELVREAEETSVKFEQGFWTEATDLAGSRDVWPIADDADGTRRLDAMRL